MDFKLSNSKNESVLISTNRDLKKRWYVLTASKLQKDIGGNWLWFNSVVERKNNKLERTRLYLGYDEVVLRPVIIKVVKYDLNDVATRESVMEKRKVLSAQIELLNDITSPLLPEPLDWFNIENSVEGLPTDDLCKTEPVLVLDYQPGVTLEYQINKKAFRRFNRSTMSVDATENIQDINLNIEKIARLADYIRYFFEQIYEKGYMYVGLSIDEILLLKDDIPRFLGLGRICKVVDGKLDNTHINFYRTVIGYSAPEFKKLDEHYVERPDAKAVAAFNLGVIIAQIMSEKTGFEIDVLQSGSFQYPNKAYEERIKAPKNYKKGQLMHNLIKRLCDPNPDTRLKDFREIERLLTTIKGDDLRGPEDEIKTEHFKEILGEIKYYDAEKGYGYLKDEYEDWYGTGYKFKKSHLEKGGITSVTKGQKVIFEKVVKTNCATGSKEEFVTLVRNARPSQVRPEKTPPKRDYNNNNNQSSSDKKSLLEAAMDVAGFAIDLFKKL